MSGHPGKQSRALMLASVASMIGQFNMENIRLLLSMGYRVDVAANFKYGSTVPDGGVEEIRRQLVELGVGIYHVPIPRSVYNVPAIVASLRRVKKLCKKSRYQLVHCHSPIGGVLARICARKQRKRGCKVVYTAHGFHFYQGAPLKNWLLYYPAEWVCSWWTDTLVTINREDYIRAKKHLHAKKTAYVPGVGIDLQSFHAPDAGNGLQSFHASDAGNGLQSFHAPDAGNALQSFRAPDVENGLQAFYAPDAGNGLQSFHAPDAGIDLQAFHVLDRTRVRKCRGRLGLSDTDIMVLSVGELSARKDHETAIRALAKLGNPDIRYFICGIGKLEGHLRRLVKRLRLERKVRFLGYRKDIRKLCQAADLFLFPSRQEGLAVSLMEAAACGTPIICSKIRGNVDLIKNERAMFEAGNVESLVACLARNLGNGTRQALQSGMQEMAAENYRRLAPCSLANVTEKMAGIYGRQKDRTPQKRRRMDRNSKGMEG